MIALLLWLVMTTAAIFTLAGSQSAAVFLAIMTLVGLFAQLAIAVGKAL